MSKISSLHFCCKDLFEEKQIVIGMPENASVYLEIFKAHIVDFEQQCGFPPIQIWFLDGHNFKFLLSFLMRIRNWGITASRFPFILWILLNFCRLQFLPPLRRLSFHQVCLYVFINSSRSYKYGFCSNFHWNCVLWPSTDDPILVIWSRKVLKAKTIGNIWKYESLNLSIYKA